VDVHELVARHYGAGDTTGKIVRALAEAGLDIERLGPADLFALDQLHAGGPAATQHVLDKLVVGPGVRLLDLGCGIGGTSRMAAMTGAEVTGIDLSPSFIETAASLTALVRLEDRIRFLTAPGESLPLADASYDAAVMVHVGMNVPDKQAVFAEAHRVLAPGGRFAVYEQMRTGAGDLTYPLPWADDARSSFVEPVEDYVRQLEAVGFTIVEVEDRTSSTLGGPPTGPVTNATVFGPPFVERIGNNIAGTKAGLLGAILVVAGRR
jgi:SAM-dependent methyltransferase